MRKTKYIVSFLFVLFLTSVMSVSVLADNLFDENNLEKVYETTNTKFKGYYYADNVVHKDTIASQIQTSLDQAAEYVNVLRIYAEYCDEIDPNNDSSQLMEEYLTLAGLDSSQPAYFMIRGADELIIMSNDAFDQTYGENASKTIDKQANTLLFADDNENSYETNTCLALVSYMKGELADLEEEVNNSSSSTIQLPQSESSEDTSYENSQTKYKAVIQDDAGLLTNKTSLLGTMKSITEHENIMFASTNSNYTSASSYARSVGESQFGSTSKFTVLLIDMDNRQIYIYSSKSMYNTITTSKANIIADNIYKLATNGDYDACAQKGFEQILTVLQGDPLSSPMKLIGCILISLVGGMSICWLVMLFGNSLRRATSAEIESGMGDSNFFTSGVRQRLIRTHFVKASSSSGGGGGGGGGSSGGGGGGGGHGF